MTNHWWKWDLKMFSHSLWIFPLCAVCVCVWVIKKIEMCSMDSLQETVKLDQNRSKLTHLKSVWRLNELTNWLVSHNGETLAVFVCVFVCVDGEIPSNCNSLESRGCCHGNTRMGISLVTDRMWRWWEVGISPWRLWECRYSGGQAHPGTAIGGKRIWDGKIMTPKLIKLDGTLPSGDLLICHHLWHQQ